MPTALPASTLDRVVPGPGDGAGPGSGLRSPPVPGAASTPTTARSSTAWRSSTPWSTGLPRFRSHPARDRAADPGRPGRRTGRHRRGGGRGVLRDRRVVSTTLDTLVIPYHHRQL